MDICFWCSISRALLSLPLLLKSQHIVPRLAVVEVTAQNLYLFRAIHICSFADTEQDHYCRPGEEVRREWLLGRQTRRRLLGERVWLPVSDRKYQRLYTKFFLISRESVLQFCRHDTKRVSNFQLWYFSSFWLFPKLHTTADGMFLFMSLLTPSAC